MSPTNVAEELSAGEIVAGRYHIEVLLGRGGMGTVWRAKQAALGRQVAIKVLSPLYASSPDARARFEREARVASAMKHPGAVDIYDFGEHEGMLYLAMEMLEGRTLRTVLDDDRASLTLERVIDIGAQVAEVLTAAHLMPLVHRDLKPENVFVQPDDRVVVVDFGLAFIESREGAGRMTQEGVITGTPDYMSPEQARGDRVGPPTDVYALGCMLFELMTGQTPFHGNATVVLTQQLFSPAPRLSSIAGAVPAPRALEELFARMLAKNAASRPSAETVRNELLAMSTTTRARERARDRTFLLGRDARVLPQPLVDKSTIGGWDGRIGQVETSGEVIPVAMVGSVDGEILIGLTANALVPYIASPEQPIEGASVIYAPGAPPFAVAVLAAHGVPVLSDTDASDVDRIRDLVRAGAADVVPRPVSADDLSRRIWRAHRRFRRNKGNA